VHKGGRSYIIKKGEILDTPVEWMKELVWQNCKNVVKKGMVSRKAAKAQRTDDGGQWSDDR